MAFDRDYVKKRIERALGGSTVEVELSSDDYEDAIDDALREFGRFRPRLKYISVDAVTGQQEYALTEEQVGLGVVDVVWEPDLYFTGSDVTSEIIRQRMAMGVVSGGIGGYVMRASQLEVQERVLGAEPSWEWLEEERKLLISPPPAEASTLSVKVAMPPEIGHVRLPYQGLFLRLAIAVAKQTLGQMRSKYAQVAGAEVDEAMNGADLIQQANDELEKLLGYPDGELRKIAVSMPPSWS